MAALAKRRIQNAAAPLALDLNAVLDAMNDAIVYLDEQGCILWSNRRIEAQAEVRHGELNGQSLAFLVPDENLSEIPARTRCFETSMVDEPGVYEDVACLSANGEVWVAEVRVSIPATGGRVVVFSDTTQKKKLADRVLKQNQTLREVMTSVERKNTELHSTQEMLVQAGKMAALGELVSGVAHELNQPLTAIKGYAQELRVVSENAEWSDFVSEILKNSEKMHTIINQLRSFARKTQQEMDWYDVDSALNEAIKLTQRSLADQNIKVHYVASAKASRSYGNALQMEQVLINLLTNARDAIAATARGSGNIWITLASVGDSYFEIRVKDDGSGMNESVRAKVFNPFFTTKEVGKGMGLGLSLSFGMIDKIHGSIQVETNAGQGTEFVVKFPIDFRSDGFEQIETQEEA